MKDGWQYTIRGRSSDDGNIVFSSDGENGNVKIEIHPMRGAPADLSHRIDVDPADLQNVLRVIKALSKRALTARELEGQYRRLSRQD